MVEQKKRVVSNRTEISKLLKNISDKELNVKVFNSLEELSDNSSSFKVGKIFKISQKDGTFSLRSVDQDFSEFEKKTNLFLQIDEEEMIFTCFGEKFGEKFGSFNLPNELSIKDRRAHERKTLSGKLSMKVFANGHEITLKVLDISKGGACLFIQENVDIFIKNFKSFEIVSVKGIEKFPKMLAKIAHGQAQKGTSIIKSLKVGIEFEELIEDDLVLEFT